MPRGRPRRDNIEAIRRLYVELGQTPEAIAQQYWPGSADERRRMVRRIKILARRELWAQVAQGVRAVAPEIEQQIRDAVARIRERFLIEYLWVMGQLRLARAHLQSGAEVSENGAVPLGELGEFLGLLQSAAVGFERLGVGLLPPVRPPPTVLQQINVGVLTEGAAKEAGSAAESIRLAELFRLMVQHPLAPRQLAAPNGQEDGQPD